jgi:uncharacterized protein with HEPN domain
MTSFLDQPMAQDAIVMRLQEIGENLARMRRIDERYSAANALDTWFRLIGLRNIISHGYHLIDAEQIWQIVKEELPEYAATIEDFEKRL